MQLWLLLLIVGLAALTLGSISGAVIGKSTVARMRGEHRTLFSRKEKIILLCIVLVGAGCVLFAVLYEPAQPVIEDPWGNGMFLFTDGEFFEGAEVLYDEDGNEIIAESNDDNGAVVTRPSGGGTTTATPRPAARPGGGAVRFAGGGGTVVRIG